MNTYLKGYMYKEAKMKFIHYVPSNIVGDVEREGLKGLANLVFEKPEDGRIQDKLRRYSRFYEGSEEDKEKLSKEDILKLIRSFREHPRGDNAIYGFQEELDLDKSETLKKWLGDQTPFEVDLDRLKKDNRILRLNEVDSGIDYSLVRNDGPALADIPHPSLITRDGNIPSKYLKRLR